MRRRFIQSREPPYDLIEVSLDYESEPRRHDDLLHGDRAYHDLPGHINSRTKHRRYMREHGLTTMDDFKGEWTKAAEKRADFFQGKPGSGSVKREHIERAIDQLVNKRR